MQVYGTLDNTTTSSQGNVSVIAAKDLILIANAGNDLTVTAYGPADIDVAQSDSADIWTSGQAEIDIQQTFDATVTVLNDADISLAIAGNGDLVIDGDLELSGVIGADLSVSALGNANINTLSLGASAVFASGNLTGAISGEDVTVVALGGQLSGHHSAVESLFVAAGGQLSGTLESQGEATVISQGPANVIVNAAGAVEVTGLQTVQSTISTNGTALVRSGGDLWLTVTQASALSVQALSDALVSAITTGELDAVAVGNLWISGVAGTDAYLGAYGDLVLQGFIAQDDIPLIWARGDLTGIASALDTIGLVTGFSDIDVDLFARVIEEVRAWGDILGLLDASEIVGEVKSAHDILATILAPVIGAIDDQNPLVNNYWPDDPHLSLESFVALLRELHRDLALLDEALGQEKGALPGVVAALREHALRSYRPGLEDQADINARMQIMENGTRAALRDAHISIQQSFDEAQISVESVRRGVDAVRSLNDCRFRIQQRSYVVGSDSFQKEIRASDQIRLTRAGDRESLKFDQYLAAEKNFAGKRTIWPDEFALRVRSLILDRIQAYVDILGFIPAFGEAADVVNFLISIARRQSVAEIALNGVGLIPELGGFLRAGLKPLAKIGGNLAQAVGDVTKILADGLRKGDWCAIGKAAKAMGIPAAIRKYLPHCFFAGTIVFDSELGTVSLAGLGLSDDTDTDVPPGLELFCILVGVGGVVILERRRRKNPNSAPPDDTLPPDAPDTPSHSRSQSGRTNDDHTADAISPSDQALNEWLDSTQLAPTFAVHDLLDEPDRLTSEIPLALSQPASSKSVSVQPRRHGADTAHSRAPFVAPSVSQPSLHLANRPITSSVDRSPKVGVPPHRSSGWQSSAWLAAWLMIAALLGFTRGDSPAHDRTSRELNFQETSAESLATEGEATLTGKRIEDLRVGDYVLARDPFTGETQRRQILRVFRNQVEHQRVLDVRSVDGSTQTIQTTDEHPFFIARGVVAEAKDLCVGDEILGFEDTPVTVIATSREELVEEGTVYNIEVDGFHTYFVAESVDDEPLWVHNACIDDAIDHLPKHMVKDGKVLVINPKNNKPVWIARELLDGDHSLPQLAVEQAITEFMNTMSKVLPEAEVKRKVARAREILNGKQNLKPMPKGFNRSKGARTATIWSGVGKGKKVHPTYMAKLRKTQRDVARQINDLFGGHGDWIDSDFLK